MFQRPESPLDRMKPAERAILTPEDRAAIQANHEWHVATVELAKLSSRLHEDFKEISRIGAQDNPNGDWWKRSLFRAMFAWIEGYVYGLKQVILCTREAGVYEEFAFGELAFLLEETHNLDKDKVKSTYRFIPIQSNIRFTFSMFARVHNLEPVIDVGGNDWQNFLKALEVRNRLTHPKALEDLNVTDEEMKVLIQIVKWFGELVGGTAQGATKFVQDLANKRASEHKRGQAEYLDKVRQRFEQAGVIEKAERFLADIITADKETTVPDEEMVRLLEDLNSLKRELVKNISA